MNTDALVLPVIISGGMWILLVGIWLLAKHTECNLLQRLLICTAFVWFAYGCWFLVRHYLLDYPFDNKILAFNRVSWGVIMALVTVAYPVTALCKQWLRNRIFKIFIIVPLSFFIVYLLFWFFTGKGFEEYGSYNVVKLHWTEPVIIMRFVLWFISIAYHLITLYLIFGAAPVYERYIKNSYSDLQYNLRWIRVIAAFLIGNMVVYTLNIFWFEWWTRLLFLIVNFPLWVFMIDQAVFGKCFTPSDEFKISWTWQKGWHEVYYQYELPEAEPTGDPAALTVTKEAVVSLAEFNFCSAKKIASVELLIERMEQYMSDEQPFTDSSLTRENFARALNTNRTTLLEAIKLSGFESFQDYINYYRVLHFKSLAASDPQVSVVSLYTRAGFATRSTFYRYFKEIEGVLPGNYMQQLQGQVYRHRSVSERIGGSDR